MVIIDLLLRASVLTFLAGFLGLIGPTAMEWQVPSLLNSLSAFALASGILGFVFALVLYRFTHM